MKIRCLFYGHKWERVTRILYKPFSKIITPMEKCSICNKTRFRKYHLDEEELF